MARELYRSPQPVQFAPAPAGWSPGMGGPPPAGTYVNFQTTSPIGPNEVLRVTAQVQQAFPGGSFAFTSNALVVSVGSGGTPNASAVNVGGPTGAR